MKYKKQTNCVYHCNYHIVLPTKYRKPIFNAGVFAYLEEVLKGVKQHYPGVDVLEINHDLDHIHILVSIPPKLAVGKVVGVIKANTARMLKLKFGFIKNAYWGNDGIWSEGYFVSTVGTNEAIVRKYIEKQGEEEFGQAELELA